MWVVEIYFSKIWVAEQFGSRTAALNKEMSINTTSDSICEIIISGVLDEIVPMQTIEFSIVNVYHIRFTKTF